ncbi:conserved hypothetical protein [Burkholderia vietnamiensis G4]|uniref:Uncharacterized protein n=1 Tax=Burkholderia vietnamiensis (strain G4 / LMG 22486) TaxID=269482 RepID=A4J9Z9_BURVG|nr:conserved hypothetical protein [Burkholderia vietnamiensis G4]
MQIAGSTARRFTERYSPPFRANRVPSVPQNLWITRYSASKSTLCALDNPFVRYRQTNVRSGHENVCAFCRTTRGNWRHNEKLRLSRYSPQNAVDNLAVRFSALA